MNFAEFGIDLAHAVGSGDEVKTTCPECSHTRKKKTDKCLNVNTADGVWHCWHCGWSGKAKGERVTSDRPKAFVKPRRETLALSEGAIKFFAKRGITEAVLERSRIGMAQVFMPQVGKEVSAIAFPYRRNGEVVNSKYRDNEKHFRMESGAERILYGYDDIRAHTVIVEGEMDKLAVEVAGLPNCVSVPDGAPAPNSKNLDSKFTYLDDEKLATVERWIIAVDNDAPGQRLQQELVRRFGPERCLIVRWPDGCKDANDVLMQFGASKLRECIDAAEPVPIVGVFDADAFRDDFVRMYEEGVPNGFTTGWESVDQHWRVQPGQLLIVTGIPGHGKSEWVDALCCNLAETHGWRTAFYSPENQPTRLHMMKLAEKRIGKPFNPGIHPRMTPQERDSAMDWIKGHFFWVMPEQPNLAEIMDKAKALVMRHGVRVLVIDPWNEVEHSRPQGMTEAEYVSDSLRRLRNFARKHEILMVVVAHPKLLEKRGDGTYPVPTPYDISGGAMWRNKADNVVAVYAPDITDQRGAIEVHVQKVKFKLFGRVGKVDMRWDSVCGRYHEVPTLNSVAAYRRASSGDE